MREIKFRTWDTENKEFSEWTNRDPFFSTSEGRLFFWERTRHDDGSYDGDIVLEDLNNRFILQQFTGLKDKNGKEIYEGDIVRYTTKTLIGNAPVVFSPFGHGFVLDSSGRHAIGDVKYGDYVLLLHSSVADITYEVIGNIFENEELIKNE